jgi:dethiobiotin synthetase
MPTPCVPLNFQDVTQTTSQGGFFITGTDTDVGKTYAACCIAHTLIQQGLSISPRKPIASGCERLPDGTLLCADAQQLQLASQSQEPLINICPYAFEAAISPQRAIALANCQITTQQLVTACQPLTEQHFCLVEGAGGFYSPLSSDGLNAELATALHYPVVLVVGNKLGCINHTLLTVEAIQNRGLTLHSVIVNDVQPNADANNFADIQCRLAQQAIPCHALPYRADRQPILLSGFIL